MMTLLGKTPLIVTLAARLQGVTTCNTSRASDSRAGKRLQSAQLRNSCQPWPPAFMQLASKAAGASSCRRTCWIHRETPAPSGLGSVRW